MSSTIAISVDWIILVARLYFGKVQGGDNGVRIRSFKDMVVLIGFDTNRKVIKSVVIKLSFYQKCLSITAYSSIFGDYF